MLINAYDMIIRCSHGQQANDKNHGNRSSWQCAKLNYLRPQLKHGARKPLTLKLLVTGAARVCHGMEKSTEI
jgi:hypothetical protein